ncbi:MAG TPA: aldolase/citrate lyase family protein, partial [Chitinispirillaceae bacterium]|nr:aldolase/citrate lyase family protein [Chitinispirillaceae bacterium]
MSQNGNVRSKLAVKNSVYGIWSLLLDPACTEIMAGSGLDFIIFDGEHGTASLSRIEENVRILKAFNCDAIVRPSKVDPVEIQRILDIGVQGILVPQVRTREDVELVVKSACLAPDGVRGYNPFTRAGHYCGNGKSEFFQNDKTIVGVLIENKDAVTNIDDILNVMGLDLIYIGVFDLSCALGVPGDVSHVKVNDMIAIITQKAVEKNISVGLMVDSKASSFRFQPLVNF